MAAAGDLAPVLRDAVRSCSARALTNAAKWAGEQLVSLSDGGSRTAADVGVGDTDATLFARTLLAAGELARAADAVAADPSDPLACFLHYYATYLASEKRREDARGDLADMDRVPPNDALPGLRDRLAAVCAPASADPFLLYLYGVVLRKLGQPAAATDALVRAVRGYPGNWSAWLELIPCCASSEQVPALLARLPDHFMGEFFRAQLYVDLHMWEPAATILDGPTLQRFPRSPFVACLRAFCLYSTQRHDDAIERYTQVREREPRRLEQVDVLAHMLYLREDGERLSQLAHDVLSVDRFRPETCCVIGNYYSLKEMRDRAIAYFERAVLLDASFATAWTLMGHEFLNQKNARAAITSYRRAADTNPHDYNAWYGLGCAYELLDQPVFALYYYRKASVLRPYDARVWHAMGKVYEKLKRNVDAIFCYEQAVDDDGGKGSLMTVGRLYVKLGNVAGAMRAYERYAALMENAQVDADLAEACLYLGNMHSQQGSLQTAYRHLVRAQQATGNEVARVEGHLQHAALASNLLRSLRTRMPPATVAALSGPGRAGDRTPG